MLPYGLRAALLAPLLFPSLTQAQIVSGRVLEDGAGTAIADAEVRLVGGDGRERARVVSDSAGWFQLRAPSPGSYSIAVRHASYLAYTSAAMPMRADQFLELEIRLGRQVIPLEPVVVVTRRVSPSRLAGFRERAVNLDAGRFVTREQIDRRPGATVADLVRTIPGVRVVPVKRGNNPQGMTTELVLMRGSGHEAGVVGGNLGTEGYCQPSILLDGTVIRQSAGFPLEDLVRSTALEGIEVYSSPTVVPPQFQVFTNCGALVLWTREAEGAGRRSWIRTAIGVAGLGLIVLLTI